jgi:hypothetical protein
MRIVTYLIEYLGKFELKFETISDYESGDQMGTFDAKKPPSKISYLGTFKQEKQHDASMGSYLTRITKSHVGNRSHILVFD